MNAQKQFSIFSCKSILSSFDKKSLKGENAYSSKQMEKYSVGDINKLSKIINQTRLLAETEHEISNNVVCATNKASDQPAHTRSLIRAFASRLSIL